MRCGLLTDRIRTRNQSIGDGKDLSVKVGRAQDVQGEVTAPVGDAGVGSTVGLVGSRLTVTRIVTGL